MRELPILFSTPMVQAIQAGTKNQTRRTAGLEKVNENPDEFHLFNNNSHCFHFETKPSSTSDIIVKSRYQKGDHIWVKETWCIIPPNYLIFKADCNEQVVKNNKWKSSLFMRKNYARIWLECTGVRCERLLDIKDEDCISEGIEKWIAPDVTWYRYKDYMSDVDWWGQERPSFLSLWESVNGRNSYKTNPWIFIYDFKVIEK